MILLCFTELAITLIQDKQHNYSLPRGLSYVAHGRCAFRHPSLQNVGEAVVGEPGPAWLHHHEPAGEDTQLRVSAAFDEMARSLCLFPGSAGASGREGRDRQR